jgi:tRNA pseudouridine38-40 synthase
MPPDASRKIKMILEYDGTNYAGWQRQANAPSVQQAVEDALERYLGQAVRVTASGRTDAGVHAMGQVISFTPECGIPADAMGRGLTAFLPRDIAVIHSADAAPDFDARRSARMRWYRFFLSNRHPRPAVGSQFLTHIPGDLNFDEMTKAANMLTGEHDFSAFRSVACTATRTRLTMQPIEIARVSRDIIRIDFRCRSFLQNMVRILTGTLVAVGRGKMTVDDVQAMLDTGQRHKYAVTVQPNGLFLWQVSYDESIEPGATNIQSRA